MVGLRSPVESAHSSSVRRVVEKHELQTRGGSGFKSHCCHIISFVPQSGVLTTLSPSFLFHILRAVVRWER